MIRDLNNGVVFVDDLDAEQIEALRTILIDEYKSYGYHDSSSSQSLERDQ